MILGLVGPVVINYKICWLTKQKIRLGCWYAFHRHKFNAFVIIYFFTYKLYYKKCKYFPKVKHNWNKQHHTDFHSDKLNCIYYVWLTCFISGIIPLVHWYSIWWLCSLSAVQTESEQWNLKPLFITLTLILLLDTCI